MQIFKVIKMNICPNLQSDLDLKIRDHCYGTRGNGLYVMPFPRLITNINFLLLGISYLLDL